MALDAIKKINGTEQAIAQRKDEAVVNVKRMVAEAEKAGAALLADSRARASAEAKKLLAEAEAAAAITAEAVLKDTRTACADLKEKADFRLEKAAQLITGRIVNS